jgi:hypothetical protein
MPLLKAIIGKTIIYITPTSHPSIYKMQTTTPNYLTTNYSIRIIPDSQTYPIPLREDAIPAHHVEIYEKHAIGMRMTYKMMLGGLRDLLLRLDTVQDPIFMPEMPPANIFLAQDFWEVRQRFIAELHAADDKLMRQNTQAVLDAFPAGSKEAAFREKIKDMSGIHYTRGNKALKKAAEGCWSTLPDKRRVMIWAFHAYEPPTDGSYRVVQPLKHLGLYNSETRTIDPGVDPLLPTTQELWPWRQ